MGNSVAVGIEFSKDIYAFLTTHGISKKVIADTSCRLLALKYYQERLLSLGKAAELAKLSKGEFIEFAGENGVPIIEDDEVNLKREFKSIEDLTRIIPVVRIEDIELGKVASSLAQNVPSLEELDKIGKKLSVSLTQMIIKEREKDRW